MTGQLFRFRVYRDQPREIEIVRPGKDTRVAEMRTVKTQLPSGELFVSSLHDITELVRLREELRAVAFIDELTGLCNRQGFFTLAHQQLKIASRTRKWLFLLLAEQHVERDVETDDEQHTGQVPAIALTFFFINHSAALGTSPG